MASTDASDAPVKTDHTRFPEISPLSWEHPADRLALNSLRRIPGLDVVLRRLTGTFGEKAIRLTFQANAVRVSPVQYPWLHEILLRVCDTLDVDEPPELYVSQTPLVNAGAVGIDRPFIVLNSSTIEMLDRDQIEFVIAHEVGHVMSGHGLYRTVLFVLLQFAFTRYPLAGVAVRPLLYALLEWSRKAELSCDRAGLVETQDVDACLNALMRMAGGSRGEELHLGEFIEQANAYREGGDTLDRVYKLLAALGSTHPFAVVRVAELQTWIESGDYDRIMAGEYTRRDDEPSDYREDVRNAWDSARDAATGLINGLTGRN